MMPVEAAAVRQRSTFESIKPEGEPSGGLDHGCSGYQCCRSRQRDAAALLVTSVNPAGSAAAPPMTTVVRSTTP